MNLVGKFVPKPKEPELHDILWAKPKMCECCGTEKATCVDYIKRYGITSKVLICGKCGFLRDGTFWEKYDSTATKLKKEVI